MHARRTRSLCLPATAWTRAALVAGGALAAACAPGVDVTPLGFVVAPSTSASASGPAPGSPFADVDAGSFAYRPLPPEPVAFGCTREVVCQREIDAIPAYAYPPPFERCSDRYLKGTVSASFSAAETRRARASDPTTCCYVALRGCGQR